MDVGFYRTELPDEVITINLNDFSDEEKKSFIRRVIDGKTYVALTVFSENGESRLIFIEEK